MTMHYILNHSSSLYHSDTDIISSNFSNIIDLYTYYNAKFKIFNAYDNFPLQVNKAYSKFSHVP